MTASPVKPFFSLSTLALHAIVLAFGIYVITHNPNAGSPIVIVILGAIALPGPLTIILSVISLYRHETPQSLSVISLLLACFSLFILCLIILAYLFWRPVGVA